MNESISTMGDDELARLAQEDEEYAAEILFGRYKEMVKGKANLYFMVGADKDDLNQEGMIGLFKAIRSYNPNRGAQFKTYADHCVNNQIQSAVQRAARKKHEPLNTSVSIHEKFQGESSIEDLIKDEQEATPEAAVLLEEQIDYIMQNETEIFSKLESQVWHLFLQGKDYVEISKSLGKSPKTIDNALQRMKTKILRLLD